MITLSGVKTRLIHGPEDEHHRQLAEERYVELRKVQRTRPNAPAPTGRVVDVIEAYLAWSRRELAADTHRVNRYYCQSFAEHCGRTLAADLIPHHVNNWLAEMASPARVKRDMKLWEQSDVPMRTRGKAPRAWGEATRHNGRTVAFRVFSWAEGEGLVPNNPLAKLKRPKPQPRKRAMTDDEFQKLYDAAGECFGDFLLAMRETGARPKELRELTWAMIHGGRWLLKAHKTAKKTGKDRVIVPTAAVREMVERKRNNGHARVFLNTRGGPWTANALRQQMTRLRESLGLGDDLCIYLARHGYATRAIVNGVDPVTLARMLGHASLDMINSVYAHVDEGKHLEAAAEKISPPTPAGAEPRPTRKRARSVKPAPASPTAAPPATPPNPPAAPATPPGG